MATASDKELTLASVYSKAILDLAESKGEADSLLDELLALSVYIDGHPEINVFFSNPTVGASIRERSIEKWFRGRASDLLVDTLQVVNRKERLGLLRAIAEAYRLDHEKLRGQVDVHVRAAVPLDDKARASLKEIAKALSGMEAKLVEHVDESVIGGLVVQIGDRKYDTSVATRLKKLAAVLGDRASREIHSGRSYFVGTALD